MKRPTLPQVEKDIEKIISIVFSGHDKEMNLKLVSAYLTENCFHVEDEDLFLESLLHDKNIFTLEERLKMHVVEFFECEEYDRNDGLCFNDLA